MKITKEEFLEANHSFPNIDDYDIFLEVHGCEFAHGQYGTPEMSRGEIFNLYMVDHYPKCKYVEGDGGGISIWYVAIKRKEQVQFT